MSPDQIIALAGITACLAWVLGAAVGVTLTHLHDRREARKIAAHRRAADAAFYRVRAIESARLAHLDPEGVSSS